MMHAVPLTSLVTPCLVVDRARLTANGGRLAMRAKQLGVRLRSHVKTPKSVEAARLLSGEAAPGITVSTLAEAEVFARAGFRDQLYATPVAPQKLSRIAALIDANVDIVAVVDSPAAARTLAAEAERLKLVLPLLVEIDVDGYRCGVAGAAALDEVMRVFDTSRSLEFRGVMSHAGLSYHIPAADRAALAERHRQALIAAAIDFESRGFRCAVRSFGSTPAVMAAAQLEGVSEVRCGIFAFQDLFQSGIGACGADDLALSVATTIVSVQPAYNRLFVDAGAIALSKDRSTAGAPFDAGYGLVADAYGRSIDDLFVKAVHQELGEITSRSGGQIPLDRLSIGTILRIFPNHADMTAAAYPFYHVVDGEGCVVEIWDRINGW